MDKPGSGVAGVSPPSTWVEEGTLFKGRFSSRGPVVVLGKIEGDITAPSLDVRRTGAVCGTGRLGEIRSEGELSGEFDAEVAHLSGVVRDKTVVRARWLHVRLSPTDCKMQLLFSECKDED